MSSRLVRPEEGQLAAPISWREMGGPTAGPGAEGSAGTDPGLASRLAQMEGHYRQAVEQARAAAFREGESAGRERAGAEMRPVLEKLTHSLEELALLRPRLRREAEADMLRLAMAVARRVLRREVAMDPDALHGLAMAALEKLGSQETHRVRVHPSLAREMRALLDKLPGRGSLEIVEDAAREPGTVIFETERGNLDASVATQLEEIERGLTDCLRRHS